jgi:hypothetical protein
VKTWLIAHWAKIRQKWLWPVTRIIFFIEKTVKKDKGLGGNIKTKPMTKGEKDNEDY